MQIIEPWERISFKTNNFRFLENCHVLLTKLSWLKLSDKTNINC